jgi:dihydrofolate reductase
MQCARAGLHVGDGCRGRALERARRAPARAGAFLATVRVGCRGEDEMSDPGVAGSRVVVDADSRVVVNRAMSLDGFIAGPGDAMEWIAKALPEEAMREQAARTGAMLVGRRTADVGERMRAESPGTADYPFSGPVFVLTHHPADSSDPGVTFLSGDIRDAVATALKAAGGKNLEILGADVAGQCLRHGLVDEILVYVLPVLLGDGIRFLPPGSPKVDLEPIGCTRAGAVTILRFGVRR